ncbi:MAG: glycosyltransferase family 4 protein [Kiritimatiellae bacterium]|nr:glycosyltransferase family 4 protein [Kiritimatiellia bacterium]
MLGLRAIGQGAGGVEKAVEELSARLAGLGHDVTVFCRARYNPTAQTSYRGVRLVNLPAFYTKHLEAISHTFLAVWHTLRGYDIVHIHATGPSLLAFIPRLAGGKVVVTVHGLDWKREKWRGPAKAVLRMGVWTAVHFAHRTIVVSRCLQDFYRERYGRETVYIPNGVTPPTRRPVDRIRRFGVSGGDYILYLGRLVPEKGCHLLIEAFRQLDTKHKLLIVGDTSHSDDYVAQLRAAASGDDRIVFTGALYGEDKDEAFSNASLFVLPSTLEGMPIVLLEALSYGCPVLCSNIPENLEIVQSEKDAEPYGAVFASGSADDLQARLTALLAEPDVARRAAARAQGYVQGAFSWSGITLQTENLYRSLVSP